MKSYELSICNEGTSSVLTICQTLNDAICAAVAEERDCKKYIELGTNSVPNLNYFWYEITEYDSETEEIKDIYKSINYEE